MQRINLKQHRRIVRGYKQWLAGEIRAAEQGGPKMQIERLSRTNDFIAELEEWERQAWYVRHQNRFKFVLRASGWIVLWVIVIFGLVIGLVYAAGAVVNYYANHFAG